MARLFDGRRMGQASDAKPAWILSHACLTFHLSVVKLEDAMV